MSSNEPDNTTPHREEIQIHGRVQGVGFRPFVFRLAREQGLSGWVRNDASGVHIEAEGSVQGLEGFRFRLQEDAPAAARPSGITHRPIAPVGESGFRILPSAGREPARVEVAPDLATCPECLADLRNPGDRREGYAFTNCTHCGPRYTIVWEVPYDRPNTSMSGFEMCPRCRAEYGDPADRRFHAQPNACPECGPSLWLCDPSGERIKDGGALSSAIALLAGGSIVAKRGLGGFHLAVDARDFAAVDRLRQRKRRPAKPFALMARDLDAARAVAIISEPEARLLASPAAPVVLLSVRQGAGLPSNLAPGLSEIGIMLPSTPLDHLLLGDELDLLVMTSGNRSDEPIAIGNEEALRRLSGIADVFLLHDREILQRCDDSVCRVQDGRLQFARRSRGYVPSGVLIPVVAPEAILAMGGDLKNTVALVREDSVLVSQHIGDLEHPGAGDFQREVIGHLERCLDIRPAVIVHDAHPDYFSTRAALTRPARLHLAVQHHHAHLAAVMAEHGRTDPMIGLIQDGTGYGEDGTVWGGEVLWGDLGGFRRLSWLRPQRLPGGDVAAREPWRMALSHLDDAFAQTGGRPSDLALPGLAAIDPADRRRLRAMIAAGINSPLTSSCGRLFDAVAGLMGLVEYASYEGEAAMRLEAIATDSDRYACLFNEAQSLPTRTRRQNSAAIGMPPKAPGSGPIDTRRLLRAIAADIAGGVALGVIAGGFHDALGRHLAEAAVAARRATGSGTVALGGGVFQNARLSRLVTSLLTASGFEVLHAEKLPPGDGGLAYGQAAIAAAILARKRPASPASSRLPPPTSIPTPEPCA